MFVCQVCGDGQVIGSPDATVIIPILGEYTCQELQEAATNGEIIESQCGIIQIVSGPCNCREDTPTVAPAAVETTPEPTIEATTPQPSPSEPTMPTPPTTPRPTNGPPTDLNNPECIESITAGKEDSALVELVVKIQFDLNPMETGWYIADSLYECFRIGVPALTYRGIQSVEERVLVVGGIEYMFVIEDSAGNGMTSGGRQGSYTVSHNDIVLVAGGGDFESEQQTFFTAPER